MFTAGLLCIRLPRRGLPGYKTERETFCFKVRIMAIPGIESRSPFFKCWILLCSLPFPPVESIPLRSTVCPSSTCPLNFSRLSSLFYRWGPVFQGHTEREERSCNLKMKLVGFQGRATFFTGRLLSGIVHFIPRPGL